MKYVGPKRRVVDKTGILKPKRKASAYSKRYGAAFKRLQSRYKTKAGAWRKGGFKACQKAAPRAGTQ